MFFAGCGIGACSWTLATGSRPSPLLTAARARFSPFLPSAIKLVMSLGNRVTAARSTIVLDAVSCTPMRMPIASEKVTNLIKNSVVRDSWYVVRCYRAPRADLRATSHEPLTTILIYLDAGAADDLGPLGDVVVQVLPEFARRHRQRFRALLVPGFLHVGPFDDFRNLRIEPVDHRLRRSSRRHEADPDGGFITWHAGLGHRRHVGQDRRALLAGGCQRSYPPALRGRRHGGDRIHHHLHLPAHHAGARVAAALVGNVHDVHVRHRLEKLAGHVVRRSGARGCVVKSTWLRLRERDALLHRKSTRLN